MAVGDLFQVVSPTPRVAQQGPTLIKTANVLTEADDRWVLGMTWRPEACGIDGVAIASGYCGTPFTGFADPQALPAFPQYVPPFVAVAQECSTSVMGQSAIDDAEARARRLLDLSQSVGIARELWRGDVAQSAIPDLPNPYLTDGNATIVGSGAVGVIRALAELEAALASCSVAGGGIIHASQRTALYWSSQHLLERLPDGRLITDIGTWVVADQGYDGSAHGGGVDASGDTDWAYATGPVDIRLGDVEMYMAVPEIARSNDIQVYAYRPFAATYDTCCHIAVNVDHTKLT